MIITAVLRADSSRPETKSLAKRCTSGIGIVWSVRIFARMRHEPQLAAILRTYRLSMERGNWAIDPAGCRDEVAQRIADELGLPVKGQDAPQGSADIKDGKYDTALGGRGVLGGPYVIRINGFDGQTGNDLPLGKPLFTNHVESRDLPKEPSQQNFEIAKKKE